jgi:hypothetical protein
VRHVEADHGQLDAAREDLRCSLGIRPDVELCGGRDVSQADRAAHQDDALRPCVRTAGEQQGDVRQRADGHERGPRGPRGQEVDGVLRQRLPLRRWEIRPVEAGLAVHVGGHERLSDERPVGARRDRDVVAADEIEDANGVGGRLLERLVARDGGDAEQLELRARQRE